MDQCFGTSDFYSTNLISIGHEAKEIVANCEPLQRQWAREHGIKLDNFKWMFRRSASNWMARILFAQVKHYRPDVLHIQDMNGTSPEFLRQIRPHVGLITGQIACAIAPGLDFSEYNLVLSSFPHFVQQFRRDGLSSEYFNLGFEPRILRLLKKTERHDAVFVGGLSTHHAERIKLLEKVATDQQIEIWGYGIESLRPDSPLSKLHRGNAWALSMYQILLNAKIVLNHHINVAGHYANNMRLYEATGVGTLLLTDYKSNLNTLFEPGKEVVAYRSPEECCELIAHFLAHDDERESIAKAGQARTLGGHTYYHRMEEFIDIVERYS
jgi:hypothetical protein